MSGPTVGAAEDDWRHHGSCRDVDPELFFPIGDQGPAARQIEAAKKVRAGCPVAGACLAWAIATRQHDGIWGGHTEDERRNLRRRVLRAGQRGAA